MSSSIGMHFILSVVSFPPLLCIVFLCLSKCVLFTKEESHLLQGTLAMALYLTLLVGLVTDFLFPVSEAITSLLNLSIFPGATWFNFSIKKGLKTLSLNS